MTALSNCTEMAVIGDDVLVSGLRLAGIRRCYSFDAVAECDVREEARKTLGRLLNEQNVSIIVILDVYARHCDDLLDGIRQTKRMTPVIIELPSAGEIDLDRVKEEYRRFVRKSIGFDLEI